MNLQVKCPKCGTIRDISGTETRVRCPSEECKARYYVTSNIYVPKDRDNYGTITYTNDTITPVYGHYNDYSLGKDLNKSVIIEGLNDSIRIYKNSYIDREGSRVPKKKANDNAKKVIEWVERYENQQSVPLAVAFHPYFMKVKAAREELQKFL